MNDPSEFAMDDITKDYCPHCARADGSMQSFEEKRKGLTDFVVRTQGFDRTVADEVTLSMMRKLPAWKKHFAEEDEAHE
jgi:uncharacterized protein CbrC (UPF0167 family)